MWIGVLGYPVIFLLFLLPPLPLPPLLLLNTLLINKNGTKSAHTTYNKHNSRKNRKHCKAEIAAELHASFRNTTGIFSINDRLIELLESSLQYSTKT